MKTQESHWNVKDCTKNWMIINLILKLWNRKILISAFFEFNDFQNWETWNIYCWILWISCLFTITGCSKLIESWLKFPKPHNLFHCKNQHNFECLLFSWNDHMISELFKTFRNWNWKCWFWELKKIRMSRNKDIKRKIKLEMVKIIGLELTMSNYKWLMHNDPS